MHNDLIHTLSCTDDYDPNAMPVEQARRFIRDFLAPVQDSEMLPIRSTLGRVVAEDILSPHDVPNHDNSAMDGFALRADELPSAGPLQLRVIGTAYAGRPYAGERKSGECIRIMTGAVIPLGCDTVVMQEHVHADGDHITLSQHPKPGQNVRYAGEDLKQGQVVFPRGHRMRPADLGLIASLGIAEIAVFRKLRVAFFSTGDELTSIGQPLQEGQIYDSNRYTLHGMLTRLGVEIIDMGVVRDDLQRLREALQQAASQADVIISSGGVSVGEADYIKQLLNDMGQVVFWKIAMKPGRPLAYGKIGHAHYFGLPGNPVAVMVTFYQFVRQALLILMGQLNPPAIPTFSVTCIEPLKKAPGRTEFQRGILFTDQDGVWKVKPIGNQSSGVLRSMSEANCFIVLPEDCGSVTAGTTVQVQVLEGIV
jgi:molybdopterin molybdotransferase